MEKLAPGSFSDLGTSLGMYFCGNFQKHTFLAPRDFSFELLCAALRARGPSGLGPYGPKVSYLKGGRTLPKRVVARYLSEWSHAT